MKTMQMSYCSEEHVRNVLLRLKTLKKLLSHSLAAGNEFLIAHVGDSVALLCHRTSTGASAMLLTEDHQPGLDEERSRIMASGGTVIQSKGESGLGPWHSSQVQEGVF